MPRVATRLPESEDAILRPVAFAVLRQLAGVLSLPQNIDVLFPGGVEEAMMTGSELGYKGQHTKFHNTERLKVGVTEEIDEHTILNTAVYQQENIPIFLDPKLGVSLYPIYGQTTMVFQITYRAPNRTSAKQFLDELRVRHSAWRAENLHELIYHYSLPAEYLHLLKHIHELRENVAGYGDEFSDWVRQNLVHNATNLTTVIGTQQQLSIAETQSRPLGAFDFNALPQPEEKDNDNGAWIINFQYSVIFDKVIGVAAQYPLAVHGQLLDDTWYSTPRASGNFIDPNKRLERGSYSRQALDHFARLTQCNKVCTVDGLRYPEFDEWEPRYVRPNTSTLLLVMLGIDPDNPREILNLEEIPDFGFQEDVLAYIKREYSHLPHYGGSAVHISLYSGDDPLSDDWLEVDENLNVIATRDLDPRLNYHLRIALVNDLLSLDGSVTEKLRLDGKACLAILSTLQWTMLRDGWMPRLIGGKVVSRTDLNEIAQRINDLKAPHNNGVEYPGMLTVNNILIVTHRRNTYGRDSEKAAGSEADGTGTPPGDRAPVQECHC